MKTHEIRTTPREGWFEASERTLLFYRIWESPVGCADRAILLLHRGHEHSGRLNEVAKHFVARGHTVFAYDARGHGRSPGRRGEARNVSVLVRDLDAFVRHITRKHGYAPEQICIVANSIAFVVAATWVHDYAPRIRCMVLLAPAFDIRLYVPFARPLIRAAQLVHSNLFIKSYVSPGLLTRDPEEMAKYRHDHLITRDIAAHLLLEFHATARRIVDDAPAIHTPTLVLVAGKDCVVNEAAQQRFHARLGTDQKRLVRFPTMRHALLHDRGRDNVLHVIDQFLDEILTRPDKRPTHLRRADSEGHTYEEFVNLSGPATLGRRGVFAIQRLALSTLGRLSRGIQIGLRHGFDSGRSLDYVYANKPQGFTALGRAIDRAYLNAIGWRGIRQRRELLQQALREAIHSKHGQCHLVDLASGGARYDIEVLREFPRCTALLRDWSEINVADARAAATAAGLSGVHCERGDAFAEDEVAALSPKADIVVVSGLYELFPGNEAVIHSLRGIHQLLKDDGILIYTCQPRHPQLELIARVLPNREGRPWLMRRRSQAEMDILVEDAGLRKEQTLADDHGIFTVSIARKRRGIT